MAQTSCVSILPVSQFLAQPKQQNVLISPACPEKPKTTLTFSNPRDTRPKVKLFSLSLDFQLDDCVLFDRTVQAGYRASSRTDINDPCG